MYVYAVPYRLNDLWVIYSLYDSDFTTCLRITNRSTVPYVHPGSNVIVCHPRVMEDGRLCPPFLPDKSHPFTNKEACDFTTFTNDYPCHEKKLPHARFNVWVWIFQSLLPRKRKRENVFLPLNGSILPCLAIPPPPMTARFSIFRIVSSITRLAVLKVCPYGASAKTVKITADLVSWSLRQIIHQILYNPKKFSPFQRLEQTARYSTIFSNFKSLPVIYLC